MWLECECGLAFEFVVAGVGFRVGFPVGCRFGFGGLSSGVCFVCVCVLVSGLGFGCRCVFGRECEFKFGFAFEFGFAFGACGCWL